MQLHYYPSDGTRHVLLLQINRQTWQMYSWDTNTSNDIHIITRGQCLKHKQLDVKRCCISSDGLHFAWFYNQYAFEQPEAEDTHSRWDGHFGVSVPPQYTALAYGRAVGRRYECVFLDSKLHIDAHDATIIRDPEGLILLSSNDTSDLSNRRGGVQPLPPGYRFDDGRLLYNKSGALLYDFTAHLTKQ